VTTMICFEAADSSYCLPVLTARSVRTADGMIMLPEPDPDVTGILPGNPALTVISPLHAKGTHILVLEVADKTFGLLVDKVTGLRRIDADAIHPAPHGQRRPIIAGTLETDGRLILVADPTALAERL
jgi:chemotaxis signal transduction protein